MNKKTAGTLTYTTAGLCLLFFWLLFGDLSAAIRESATLPSVKVLLREYHASDTMLAVLTGALPACVSLFIAPIVGYKSDRYRSRWGRRIPFLIIAAPISALALIGVGCSPWLGTHLHHLLNAPSIGINFCVLAVFCIFWTIFECVMVSTASIFGGLINDLVPRAYLGRFWSYFRMVNLPVLVIFNNWIFPLTKTHLQEIFLCVGLLFGAGFTLMCCMVKEGPLPPLEPEEGTARPAGFFANARTYLVECFSHGYYLWIFAAITLSMLTFAPFNVYAQWYGSSLGVEQDAFGPLMARAYVISFFLLFAIGWLIDRFSAFTVGIVILLMTILVAGLGFLCIQGPRTFGIVLVSNQTLCSAYFAAIASLPMLLYPRARFTQFATAGGMMVATSTICLHSTLGPLLDYSGHNYRLTLLLEGAFAVVTLTLLLVVKRNYEAMRRQGTDEKGFETGTVKLPPDKMLTASIPGACEEE